MASEMQLVGAGLAAIGTGAAAIGVGIIFGNFVNGALRNPSAAASQFTNAIIGVCVGIYVLSSVLGMPGLDAGKLGMIPGEIGVNHEWYRLLTATFLHGGLQVMVHEKRGSSFMKIWNGLRDSSSPSISPTGRAAICVLVRAATCALLNASQSDVEKIRKYVVDRAGIWSVVSSVMMEAMLPSRGGTADRSIASGSRCCPGTGPCDNAPGLFAGTSGYRLYRLQT